MSSSVCEYSHDDVDDDDDDDDQEDDDDGDDDDGDNDDDLFGCSGEGGRHRFQNLGFFKAPRKHLNRGIYPSPRSKHS